MEARREAAVLRLDVATEAPSRRRDVWKNTLQEYYYPFNVQVSTDFERANIETYEVANIRVGTVTSDSMLICRDTQHARMDEHEYFMLPMPIHGPLVLTQCGREAVTDPSSIAFVGTAEPYSYDQSSRNEVHTLRIPAPLLRTRIPSVDALTAMTFDALTNPMTPLVLSYARTFCVSGANLTGPLARGTEDNLLDLLALMLAHADVHTSEGAVRAAHRQRAIHVIESRFRDSEFTAGDVAAAINLSDRYLQKLFADHGETVSGMIRSRRVAEARRLLAKRSTSGLSVSSIAYSVGFADAAHFSRVFRRETGVAPGSVDAIFQSAPDEDEVQVQVGNSGQE
ncbi:AraC family transcriptional regulator [Rhodococcus koreensis]